MVIRSTISIAGNDDCYIQTSVFEFFLYFFRVFFSELFFFSLSIAAILIDVCFWRGATISAAHFCVSTRLYTFIYLIYDILYLFIFLLRQRLTQTEIKNTRGYHFEQTKKKEVLNSNRKFFFLSRKSGYFATPSQ